MHAWFLEIVLSVMHVCFILFVCVCVYALAHVCTCILYVYVCVSPETINNHLHKISLNNWLNKFYCFLVSLYVLYTLFPCYKCLFIVRHKEAIHSHGDPYF